jgi:hypothetical protein
MRVRQSRNRGATTLFCSVARFSAGGLAIISVWGSELTCGVGYTHCCSQHPPAGLSMVWGQLVLLQRICEYRLRFGATAD